MKSSRQNSIIELIETRSIETQEELASALRQKGYQVTQATVSRDIKQLQLIKIPISGGGYKYAVPEKNETAVSDRLTRMLGDSLLSVDFAGNNIVVRTLSGSANIAAEALDNMQWPELLGTIAGDNTIFMVVRNESDAKLIADRIREMVRI